MDYDVNLTTITKLGSLGVLDLNSAIFVGFSEGKKVCIIILKFKKRL